MEKDFVRAKSDNLPKVTVEMVLDFLRSDTEFTLPEKRGSKQCSSGREEYGDSAVGYVQLKRSGNTCTVKGRVCPEHKVRRTPYRVSVCVNEEDETVLRAECHDCPASEGGCKHAYAFLMWMQRRYEEPAPTETVSYWNKPKLAHVVSSNQCITTADFASPKCPARKEGIPECSNFLESVLEESRKHKIPSLLLTHVSEEPLNELEKLGIHYLCRKFYEEIPSNEDICSSFQSYAKKAILQEKCKEAFNATVQQSDSPLWHELRYGRITASRLWETSRCDTQGVLVNNILGFQSIFESKFMKRGKLLEPKVISVLQKKGYKLQSCGLIIDPAYPIFAASPDGIGEDFVVEVKSPSSEKTVKLYVNNGKVKPKVRAQLQLQMLLAKKKKGLLCVASPNFEKNHSVELYWESFNENFITNTMNRATLFWEKHIFQCLSNTYSH